MGVERGSAPRVADRWLLGLLGLLLAGVAAASPFALAQQGVGWRPGDALGHLIGIAGAGLMGLGIVLPLIKRVGSFALLRPWWHQAHLLLGMIGASMAVVHASWRLGKAPTLVLLAALGILVVGAYGRLLAGRLAHIGFAGDPLVYLPSSAAGPASLLSLVKGKEKLLAVVDPASPEGTFSLTPGHWMRHPLASAAFSRLCLLEEAALLRRRRLSWGPVLLLQRYWRMLHLSLVVLLGLGILAHTVMVLFFAGYLAGDAEPYWWYVRK